MSDQPVNVDEANRLMREEGYVYLDVRTEAEYAAGHPAGAINVPVLLAAPAGMKPNPDFVAVVRAALSSDAKILVGCKAGPRSARAVAELRPHGFTTLVDVRGGWGGARNAFGQVTEPGWEASGLPSETTTPGGSYSELRAKAGL